MTEQERLLAFRAPSDLLRERTVLITGASRGIGRAISIAAANCGAEVILLARNVRELESLAEEIEANDAPAPCIVPMNLEGAQVSDYEEVARLIGERYTKLDGLILNAGMLGEMTPLASYDPVTWARVFQVNVHSQFLLTQALLPHLHNAEAGSIIFTSSGVGRQARAYWGAYAASKFANEGMMQVLADELEANSSIRVNSLNPGRLRTAMRAAAYPAEDPLTLAEPHEIANAYLFLLGLDSRDVRGCALNAQAPVK